MQINTFQPDVPVMLEKINESGISMGKLAEIVGISKGRLTDIKNEREPWPEAWNQFTALLCVYARQVDDHLPVYGEHNE